MQIDGDPVVRVHQRHSMLATPIAYFLRRRQGEAVALSVEQRLRPLHVPLADQDIQVLEGPQRQVPVDRRGDQGAFEGECLDALCR